MSENVAYDLSLAPPVRRPWIRNLVFGALILICGIAIGSVVTAVHMYQPARVPWRSGRVPAQIAEDMQRKYDLTDDQKQKLQALFEEYVPKLATIRAEVQPRIDAEHEAIRRSIESILTPEQAEKWRPEYERMSRLWRSRPGERPGPPEKK